MRRYAPNGEIRRGEAWRRRTYPDIPPMEVLGLGTPPEEEVSPYPGACSTIWLHDVGGAS